MDNQLPRIGPRVPLPSIAGKKRVSAVRGELMSCFPGQVDYVALQDFTTSVVCIGAGGGSVGNEVQDVSSGAGGGLSWTNGLLIKKGDTISLIAGLAGEPAQGSGATVGVAGGSSLFLINGVSFCTATGGGGGNISTPPAGGTSTVGDGGGTGGAGAQIGTSVEVYASGGGAAGYSGNGAAGVVSIANASGLAAPAGGGGGSGGMSIDAVGKVGGSGGVNVFGEGASGSAGSNTGGGGGGGSGGEDGETTVRLSAGRSGMYGAGGCVGEPNAAAGAMQTQHGAPGTVRVVIGERRNFPSTDVGPS